MIVEDLEFSEEINKDKFIKINGCGSWDFKFTTTVDPKSIADIDIHLEISESIDVSVYPKPDSFIDYPFDIFAYTEEPGEYSVITTSSLVH